MNNDDDNLGPVGGLHRKRSPHVVSPTVSVKDRTVVGPPVFRDFATDHMLW
jgi:hypothetical protein